MFTRFDRVRQSRRGLAFTMMEAVVTMVVVALLMGMAALAFSSSRKSARDNAGTPLLGAVQAQTRGLVAANGYTLPTDTSGTPGTALAARLTGAGLDGATFTTDPSTAQGSDDSLPDRENAYVVSVTQEPSNPGLVGYAVRTSGQTGPGCLMVVDQVSGSSPPALNESLTGMVKRDDLSTTTTGWWESTADFASPCKVVLPPASNDPAQTPLSPTCQIAELGADGNSITVSWTPQGNPTGYKVHKYNGAASFTSSVTADPALNWLPVGFSTAEDAVPVALPTPASVTSGFTGDAWQGSRAYLLTLTPATGTVDLFSSPRKNVSAVAPGTPVTFSAWAKRVSSSATDVAVKPVIVWYGAGGTEVARTAGATTVLGPMYKRLVATAPTIPAGATEAAVTLVADTLAAPLYSDVQVAVDGFALEAAATPGSSNPTPASTADVPGASTSSWTDTAVTPGNTYTYVVTAYTTTGATTVESPISEVAVAQQLPTVTVPPSGVTGLTATQVAGVPNVARAVDVQWAPAPGALSQMLYRKVQGAADDTYVRLAELPATATSYTDTDVAWGVAYTYKVAPTSGSTPVTVCGRVIGGQVQEGTSAVVDRVVLPNGPTLAARPEYERAGDAINYTYSVPANKLTPGYVDTEQGLPQLEIQSAPAPAPGATPDLSDYRTVFQGDPGVVLDVQNPAVSAQNTGNGVPVVSGGATVAAADVTPGSIIYYRARTSLPGLGDPGRTPWSTPVSATQPLATPVPSATITPDGVATVTFPNVPGATSYAIYADNTAPGYSGPKFSDQYDGIDAASRAYPVAGGPPDLTFGGATYQPVAASVAGAPYRAGAVDLPLVTDTMVTVNGAQVPGRTATVNMGNPSKQTFQVVAFRHDSGVFSDRGASPDTVASPTVTATCSVPDNPARPLTATVNLTAKTGTPVEYRLMRKGANGLYSQVGAPLPTSTTSLTQTIYANTTYQVVPYFTWPSTATLVAGNYGPSSADPMNPTYEATCQTPPLAVDMTTFFAGTDGSGLFNDQYVAIDPSAHRADGAATYYYAVFDAPAYPNATGVMKAPQYPAAVAFDPNNPGFFVPNDDGTTTPIPSDRYVVVQMPAAAPAAPAPAAPASPAPANTTACVGDKIIVGPPGAPCGNQVKSLARFGDRQVFAAAGQYNVWGTYVMALAVLNSGDGSVSYDGAYAAQASPFVTAPVAPPTSATLKTATTGAASWQDPYVSTVAANATWTYTGALGAWASQDWALTGVQRQTTRQMWSNATGSLVTSTDTPAPTTWNSALPPSYAPGATVAFSPTDVPIVPGTTATFSVRYQTKVPASPPPSTGTSITSGFDPTLWRPDGRLVSPPSQGNPTTKEGQWNNDGVVKAPPAAPRVSTNYATQWTAGDCTNAAVDCDPTSTAVEVQVSPQPGQPWADDYAFYVRPPNGLNVTAASASPTTMPNTTGKPGYRSWFMAVPAGGNVNVVVQARNAPTYAVTANTTVKIHATSTPNATVMGNLTSTNAVGPGSVAAFPCDTAAAGTALYAKQNQTTSAFVTVRTDANGDFCVLPSVTTSLIWDQTVDTTVITSHAPERKVDTRNTSALTANVERPINVGATNTTVLGSLTALPAAISANVRLATCGTADPSTAASAATGGGNVTVGATVRSDAAGNICATSSVSGVHVLWDQVAETNNLPASGPVRTYDSRTSDGALPAGGTRLVPAGVPNSTVFGALTVGPGSSFLTAYPTTDKVCAAPPNASSVNPSETANVTNATAVRTDANGNFCVFSSNGVSFLLFDRQAATQAVSVSAPLRRYDSRNVADYANRYSDQFYGRGLPARAEYEQALSPPTDGSYLGKMPTFVNTFTRNHTTGAMTPGSGATDQQATISNAILGYGQQWGPYLAIDHAATFRVRSPQTGTPGSYLINWINAYCIDLGGSASSSTSYWGGTAQQWGFVRRWGGNRPTIANNIEYHPGTWLAGTIPSSVAYSYAYQLGKWGSSYVASDRNAQAASVWYSMSAGAAGNQFVWGDQAQVFNTFAPAILARAVEASTYGGPNAVSAAVGTPRAAQAVGAPVDVTLTNLAAETAKNAGRPQTRQPQYTWAVPLSGPQPPPQVTGAPNGSATFTVRNKESAASDPTVLAVTTSLPTALLTLTPPNWNEASATGQRMWVAGLARNGATIAVDNAGVGQRRWFEDGIKTNS